MKKAAFFNNGERVIGEVYGQGRREQVAALTELYPEVVALASFEAHAARLGELEVIFSTWGMPQLSAAQLERLPALQAVFYAAGSVQNFARPFLEKGITVVSAWAANGIPVAEFTLAQILLANKGYFRNVRDCQAAEGRRTAFRGPGNFGATVAVLGAGKIGRKVIELLQPFQLQVVVYDPYLSDEEATQMGVEKVSLEAAFERANVITNHVPNLPATVGMLDWHVFQRLRDDAVFINTGRGQQVVEADLMAELEARPTLTALLDVTHPEPPLPDSPVYELPNVLLTSHIAGSIGDEVVRMADYCIEEFQAWEKGEPLRYAVTPDMLDTMA